MAKSRDAFRTISEVSDALDTPTHVLRFWESKFTQIKPVKRAGGRRYYRPDDVDLLAGIKTLLHDYGMTIKGAQKLLREQGVKHVAGLAGETNEPVIKEAEVAVETAAKPEESVDDNIVPIPVAPTEVAEVKAKDPEVVDAVETPVETPKMPPDAAPKTPERTTILAEVAAPNQMMVKSNAAKIAALLTKLETLRDAMRAA